MKSVNCRLNHLKNLKGKIYSDKQKHSIKEDNLKAQDSVTWMISGLSTEQEPNFDGKNGEFIQLGFFKSQNPRTKKRCVQKAKFVKKTLDYTTETSE
jgi:hypothetical protein